MPQQSQVTQSECGLLPFLSTSDAAHCLTAKLLFDMEFLGAGAVSPRIFYPTQL